MSRLYRSAQGAMVDMEKLRLANEETIAVGNMKVNARGDELGPGGKVIKSRNQVMKEYYEIKSPNNAGAAKPMHRGRNRPNQPIEVEAVDNFESMDDSAIDDLAAVPQPEQRRSKKGTGE